MVLWAVAAASLVLAAALTVLRCADPSQPRLIELAALAPASIPIALVTITASGAAWIVQGKRRSGARAAACAAAAGSALLVAHLVWLAPLFLGDTASPSGPQVVVLAQNFEYGDAGALAQLARSSGAEVVVLSDLPPNQLAALRRTDLLDRYAYQVGIHPDGPDGTVILSTYPLIELARISDGADSRLVRVDAHELGGFDLVAVHMTPPYQGDSWTQEYAVMESFLGATYGADTKASVVLAGDFNATPNNAPFRRILDLGFQDGVDQVNGGYQPTWPAGAAKRQWGIGVPPLVQIDHVLVSRGLDVSGLRTVQVRGSDHLGLVVQVGRA
ncbi:hypothetical protein GCM10027053_03130 [Intrasporangium mesophilum]